MDFVQLFGCTILFAPLSVAVLEIYGQILRKVADKSKYVRTVSASLAYLAFFACVIVPMLRWDLVKDRISVLIPGVKIGDSLIFGFVLSLLVGAIYFYFRHMNYLKTKGFF